jgi:hypothetical protein
MLGQAGNTEVVVHGTPSHMYKIIVGSFSFEIFLDDRYFNSSFYEFDYLLLVFTRLSLPFVELFCRVLYFSLSVLQYCLDWCTYIGSLVV